MIARKMAPRDQRELLKLMLAFLFAKGFARQVDKLVAKIKEIDNGNLKICPTISKVSEFYLLDQALCAMARNIDTLNSDILKVQKQRQMIHIIDHLSDFYKIALSKGNEIIGIQDEIKLVRSYVELQNLSYGGRIHLSIALKAATADMQVCKMTLQPFVEYSIVHGLAQDRDLHIAIEIAPIGQGGTRIRIIDDGLGIEEGFVRRGVPLPRGRDFPHPADRQRQARGRIRDGWRAGQARAGASGGRRQLRRGQMLRFRRERGPDQPGLYPERSVRQQELSVRCDDRGDERRPARRRAVLAGRRARPTSVRGRGPAADASVRLQLSVGDETRTVKLFELPELQAIFKHLYLGDFNRDKRFESGEVPPEAFRIRRVKDILDRVEMKMTF